MPLKDVFDKELLVTNGINIFSRSSNPDEQKKINEAAITFSLFCKDEYSSENINFLFDIYDLDRKRGEARQRAIEKEREETGQEPSPERLAEIFKATEPSPETINDIYQKYIIAREDAVFLNLPGSIKDPIIAAFAEKRLTLDSFEPAAKNVLNLLNTDTLPRFKKQEQAKIWFNAHNFSGISDLETRQREVIHAINEAQATRVKLGMDETGFKSYVDLLEAERDQLNGKSKANIRFQPPTDPKKIKILPVEKKEYDSLLLRELRKIIQTPRTQKGVIDKIKSAFTSMFKGRSVHPVNEDAQQNAPPNTTPTEANVLVKRLAGPETPQPEAPKPTKPPRQDKVDPSFAQKLADLKKAGKELQAGPPNSDTLAGHPFTTQKAAQNTPSMQKLAEPKDPKHHKGLQRLKEPPAPDTQTKRPRK